MDVYKLNSPGPELPKGMRREKPAVEQTPLTAAWLTAADINYMMAIYDCLEMLPFNVHIAHTTTEEISGQPPKVVITVEILGAKEGNTQGSGECKRHEAAQHVNALDEGEAR